MSTGWGAPPGWYPDPTEPSSLRWWDGGEWQQRKPRRLAKVMVGSIVLLTAQGCATALSQAPTCHPSGPVSTPSTTSFGLTVALWLLGLLIGGLVLALWLRRRWTPRWPPVLLLVAAAVMPAVTWFFMAASCGL